MIAQIQMRRGTTAEWAAASPVVLAAGEPGWDSTLKGMKVGDGSTEWAALPWIDAKNADTRLGQNILHNWDFRNPVNQRGASWVSGANTYGLDRWKSPSWGGAYRVDAGSVSNHGGLAQRIENVQQLLGKVATLSICVSGVIQSRTFTIPSAVGGSVTLPVIYATASSFFAITVTATSSYLDVEFNVNQEIYGIEMVKLELGPISTLHLDPPMDHAVELPKCQRFYRVIDTYSGGYCLSGFADGSTVVRFLYQSSCHFRGPITASISGVLPIANASGSLTGADIASISQALSDQNNSVVTLLCTASAAISAGTIYVGHYTGGRIALSSDL